MAAIVGLASGYDIAFISLMEQLNKFYETSYPKQTIKHLLTNPRQVQKRDIMTHYPWRAFVLSFKADGQRCLLLLGSGGAEVLTERSVTKYAFSEGACDDEFIFETELVGSTFLCYDLHMAHGRKVFKQPYTQRLEIAAKVISELKGVRFDGF